MRNKDDFIGMLNDWLSKGNINGKTVNQENLDRFNKANLLAYSLFKPKKIDMSPPQQNLSFAEARMYAERVEFESAKEKSLFEEFTKLVDYFNVSSISSTELSISYSIDNVWEE